MAVVARGDLQTTQAKRLITHMIPCMFTSIMYSAVWSGLSSYIDAMLRVMVCIGVAVCARALALPPGDRPYEAEAGPVIQETMH